MRATLSTLLVVVFGLAVSWAVLVADTVRRQPAGAFYE